jgi:hypothetical protein
MAALVPFVGPLTIGPLQAKRFSGNLMADEKYDQHFFLALAANGKDAWNAWRRDPANKDVRVTSPASTFPNHRGIKSTS